MPFESLTTAVIETALNSLIKDDPELGRRLSRFQGKVLQVHLKELNQTLTFVFSQQIDVLSRFEGEPDCYLSLNIVVLPELRDHSKITQLIKQDKLELTGDIQLAQKFSQLLVDSKPDIEEWLSKVVGDALAHTLVFNASQLGERIVSRAEKSRQQIAEVLTEEWRVAPAPLEVADFCDQVDEVRSQTARLEVKLMQLMERL